MRLIDTQTFELKDFGSQPPPYAILSHTWDDEEVTFQDMSRIRAARKKNGFAKIERCCRQALRDGFDWVWIDTCCIDKTSSAELSETINSMFKWYERALKCYAFLVDVYLRPGDAALAALEQPAQQVYPVGSGDESSFDINRHPFFGSNWWSRGWTLQELIAPYDVEFYNCDWERLTSKRACKGTINCFVGIPLSVLDHTAPLASICAAERISWASDRVTTREEDMAYCLLGILDVNMPLLYGEGGLRAFQRLQEQVISTNEDYTLFLWDLGRPEPGPFHDVLPSSHQRPTLSKAPALYRPPLKGVLAGFPDDFHPNRAWSHWSYPKSGALGFGEPPRMTSRGLHLSLFLREITLNDFNGPSRLASHLRASSFFRHTNDLWSQSRATSPIYLGAFPTSSTSADRILPCLLLFDTRGFDNLDDEPKPSTLVTDERSVAIYARVRDYFYTVPMTEVVANRGWDFKSCFLKTRIEPKVQWHELIGRDEFYIWRTPGSFAYHLFNSAKDAKGEIRQCAYVEANQAFPGCLLFVAAQTGGYWISHRTGVLREDMESEAWRFGDMDLSAMWIATAREAGPLGEHRFEFEAGSLLITLVIEQPGGYKVYLALEERDSRQTHAAD